MRRFCFVFVVLFAVGLDFGDAGKEIGAGEIARGDVSDGLAFVDGRNASDEITLSLGIPNLYAGRESAGGSAGNTDAFANLSGAIFRLIIASDAAPNEFPVLIQNPQSVES